MEKFESEYVSERQGYSNRLIWSNNLVETLKKIWAHVLGTGEIKNWNKIKLYVLLNDN